MEAQVAGLKIEIAAGLAKVDLTPLQNSLDKLHDVLTDPVVLQGISDLVSEVAQLAGWLVKAAAGAGQLAASTGNRFAALSGKIDLSNIDQVNERIAYLQKTLEGKKGFYSQSESMFGWITGVDDSAKSLNDELLSLIETRDKFSKASKEVLPLQTATVGNGNPFALPPGGTNGKPVKSLASKTDNAFNSRLLDLQKQAALIETTGKKTAEVTELEKVNFDVTSGNLKKLSEGQKDQLRTAAKILDSKKEELRLNQENYKLSEFVSGLDRQNKIIKQGFDNDISGRALGVKDRSRMRETNSIQQDFESRQEDLLKQYQSGDITKSLYDSKTDALKTALEERLKIQEDYYKESDDLRNDWESGISSSLADFADSSSDYYQQAADAMTSILGSATDSISEHLYDVISGTESMGDAIKGIFADLGKSVIKALVDMAAQWIVYQGVQMLVNKTAQASAIPAMIANAQATALQAQLAAFASTAAIPIVGPGLAPAAMASAAAVTEPMVAAISAASLSGMAHDGVDSVPETGTWLLQKGERVTTAKTSAKLDATLDRVANQSSGSGGYSPNITIPINGNPSDATIALVKQAADEGAQRGYRMAVNSVYSGQGDLHKALQSKTNSGRKIG